MKTFQIAGFAAVLVAITTVAAPAGAEGRHAMGEGWGMRQMMGMMGPGAGQGQGQRFMERFGIVDANDDGRISDDEAAAQREAVFAAMDADDSADLTEVEFMTVRMGPGEGNNEERRKARQDAKRARFAPMDADKSGTVSKAEFMAEGKARFAAADADGDGVVTPWEFRANRD